MLDVDFLRLAWLAWLAYEGDSFTACHAFEQFESTRHINCRNLRRILREDFDISERTQMWLVGYRRLPLSEFVREVASAGGRVPADIAGGWVRPVLIRRSYL
ncbi:hypothetical protein [Paraburkholderia hospita]|uniref:hypothetical protein n=1 Tax=Paraburkholderia hospita TaxID=169430 RepID=UPI0002716195|nr:hypothetical protein [Paraburkholderia hospita]EUC15020.1 hypothetical protein PMI06_006196 [Burkholderia sp. BT03]SKC94366.1 hypothetical protein SAMN06266956_6244 [Paraburkholderia hospita]